MNSFLISLKPLKLNQGKINHLNTSIIDEEIETVIKRFPTKNKA